MIEIDHVGYTGSRRGHTPQQTSLLIEFLTARKKMANIIWFHHGDCVGGDTNAHGVACKLGFLIHIHPPINEKLRAFNTPYNAIDPPYSFSGRNQRIAVFSRILFAAPQNGSIGTWNCVDHAVRARTPVTVIYPNGEIENK